MMGTIVLFVRLKLTEKLSAKKIYRVLIGVHEGNIGSWKTVEKCGGILENAVHVEGDEESIRRYWIAGREYGRSWSA